MEQIIKILKWIRSRYYSYFLRIEIKKVLQRRQNNQPLYYILGDSGYGSEVLYMIWAKIFCEKFNIPFILVSNQWNQCIDKGWKDFFDVSEDYLEDISIEEFRLRNRMKRELHFSRSYTYRNPFTIKNYLLGSDIWSMLRSEKYSKLIRRVEFMKTFLTVCSPNKYMINRYNEMWQSFPFNDKPYIALFGRRGDKIIETQPIYTTDYIFEIEKHSNITTNLFVATDDIELIYELREKMKSYWNIFSFTTEDERGYINYAFNKMSKTERKEKVEKMFFNLHILSKASIFIGTATSNSYHIVALERGFKNCRSLDKMLEYEYFINKLWNSNECS